MYNKGLWKDFVNYNTKGRLPPNTTAQKLFLDVDKAIIDRDIIVKLVDTPGQVIDWDDLRGSLSHFHPQLVFLPCECGSTVARPWLERGNGLA